MKYDFTSIIDRKGKDAIAVDAPGKIKNGSFFAEADIQDGFDLIPMWVADMNFPTVPSIPAAIIERAKHPTYGYFFPRKEYFEAIINCLDKLLNPNSTNLRYYSVAEAFVSRQSHWGGKPINQQANAGLRNSSPFPISA